MMVGSDHRAVAGWLSQLQDASFTRAGPGEFKGLGKHLDLEVCDAAEVAEVDAVGDVGWSP